MQKVICFGASGGGKRLYEIIKSQYEIIAFTDNDPKKWGLKIGDCDVLKVDECLKLKYDKVIITSLPGYDSIKKQLIEYGIKESVIDASLILLPLESRRIFLEKLAINQKEVPDDIKVAEAGVFEGDFAKWINKYYPTKELHLFDTFTGFDKNDLKRENEYSTAVEGDYSNTSVELVINKMPFKEKLVIHKGYFPESASEVSGKFCFVNLDLDLFEPTYKGLKFFSDKMITNGVILVHDYYAENFKGPKNAVDKFIEENNGRYSIYPIGDGFSVMVVGF